MNLIEAWKAAKDGQKIDRVSKPGPWAIIKSSERLSKIIPIGMPEEFFLADDWEIVREKEKKKVVIEAVRWASWEGAGPVYPSGSAVS